MLKKIAVAAITATILVGFQTQAHAFLGMNGAALNGVGSNGVALNGVGINGVNLNGVAINGVAINGVAINGVAINGVAINGVEPSGRETYFVDRHASGESSTVLAITLPQARVAR